MILYRYLSAEYALKSIKENRYRVGPLESLNDVFDCAPRFVPSKESTYDLLKNIHNPLVADLGVLCFSNGWDNLLLWAHYSSGYSGIALGFERNKLVTNELEPFIREVTYKSPNRPVFSESELSALPGSSPDRFNYIFDRYSEKGPDWDYEKETRIFIPFNKCIPIGKEFFYEIKSPALKEIILGPKCNLSRTLISSSIKKEDRQRVTIRKAVPDEERFALKFADDWK